MWVTCQLSANDIYYVKAGSNGNGKSWATASGDLQGVLKMVQPGDQIWIAAGHYFPTSGTDRMASFTIPTDVSLYGGFQGLESEISVTDRNWKSNLTVLSGEIGTSSINDNSYTVVYTKDVSPSTIIDGFVITGGTSNGTGQKGDSRRCGAGWYNDGVGAESSPSINNCLFVNNQARDGAGIYNNAFQGICNPSISNSQFVSNIADLDGGAINNNGNEGSCNPAITNCLFEANEATYGAGIINQGDLGESRPFVSNCVFKRNMSYIKGSGIYNNRQDVGICEPVLQACRFVDNKSSVGREISSTVNNSRKDKSVITFRSGF